MSPSNREQLETILRNQSVLTPYTDIMAFAEAVLTAGWLPRSGYEVGNVQELDLLPIGSIVEVGEKIFRKKTNTFFCWDWNKRREPSETVIDLGTPVLIYRGENQ